MSVSEGRPTWREDRIQQRIGDVLENPATHFWLRAALATAITKAPVDALNDAEALYLLLKERWGVMLEAEDILGQADADESRGWAE